MWVQNLAVHNDGTGSKLYALGPFSSIGGVASNCLAAWDGSTWTTIGEGGFPRSDRQPHDVDGFAHRRRVSEAVHRFNDAC
jgi:hypothetical protein